MANTRFPFISEPIFLVTFATLFCSLIACPSEELYVIKPLKNQELALDGSDSSLIRLQQYTAVPSQLWSFEEGDRVGLFYIINNDTGKALDFYPSREGWLGLVAKEKRKTKSQQWAFNLDGKVRNAENRRNFDVDYARFVPGTHLVVHQNFKTIAQEFVVDKFQFTDLLIHEK